MSSSCRCGHLRVAHEHYRPGSDCALCDCQRLQVSRLSLWRRGSDPVAPAAPVPAALLDVPAPRVASVSAAIDQDLAAPVKPTEKTAAVLAFARPEGSDHVAAG